MEKKTMRPKETKEKKSKKIQDIRMIPKVQTAEGWRRQHLQEQMKTKGKAR